MAKKATKDQKDQVEALSYIDALITILGDYPETLYPLTMNVNPFGFLIDICKSLGIFDELLLFLVKFIQNEIPLVELGVKGILLANIKELVSCSSDPFIPNYLRKQINGNSTSGITFTISDLDYNGLMQVNPLLQGSEYNYLGIPRRYIATYKIIQENATSIVDSTSKQFKNKEKAKIWFEKEKSKFIAKYKEDEDYKYEVNPEQLIISEIPIEETKKDKKTGKKTKTTRYEYEVSLTVTAIAKDSKSIYIDDMETFETYQEAASYISGLDKKYGKTYTIEKGCFKTHDIRQEVLISPYELARAKDFNAFLWFIVHLANFNQPQLLNIKNGNNWLDGINKSILGLGVETNMDINDMPLGTLRLKTKDNISENEQENASNLLGTAFSIYDGQESAVYTLCVKSEKYYDKNRIEKGREYMLIPATSDNKSLNWYADRGKYFDFLKYWGNLNKEETNSPRNYDKEIGICNIEFNENVLNSPNFTNFNRNQLRFTILPKPMYHIPKILDKDNPFNFKKLLFNGKGEFDKNGKFSIFLVLEHGKTMPNFNEQNKTINGEIYVGFYNVTNKGGNNVGNLWIPKEVKSNNVIFETNGTYSKAIPLSSLYECYPNLTIYEFNYDYVMSQRLFDAKVVVGELIQGILNTRLGLSGNLQLSINHTMIDGRLRQVVIDMLQSDNIDAFTINECFNSFSNDRYNKMLKETELKKAQGVHLEGHDRTSTVDTKKIEEILNNYDNPDITQEGKIDVLKAAFTQAMVSITEGTDDVEVWDVKFDFISQLIIDLVFTIIKALLTPKILMLIAVNKQLMGDDTEWTGNVLENLLGILMNIIAQIIKEISKMLLDELLNFVLGFLKPKFGELAALIAKEYFEQYRDQFMALITACGLGWGSGVKTADTALDTVTYADIDPIKEVTENKEC